ncbi:MAG: response regulator transcription factor [Tissierellia bacterium]|nr:response regulator transcription factor [Tissierellia bacterium]
MNKIFIVEDDPIIANSIKSNLTSWRFEVRVSEDYKNVIEEFQKFSPNLVLLDITLPFFNGYHWCKMIREKSTVPIIFLSSSSENLNIIMAMDLGADDYITKPFNMDILLAKIRALLRRSYDFVSDINFVYHNGLELNLSEMKVSYEGKTEILTKNEFKILELLLKNKGSVITREKLMKRLWMSDEYIDDNTLTVNVARLRTRLKEIGVGDLIITKVGVGYYVQGN